MGLTDVEAWDSSNLLAGTITGESSRTGENEYGLRAYKNSFYKKLQTVAKRERWSTFACAEVNAAYLLTVGRDAKVKDVRIRKAVDGNLLKDPCKNCSQWLELTDTPRVYKIRATFLPSEANEGESRVPKNGGAGADPFPALPTSTSGSK